MGDEVGRTQRGNNNVYCQDNELAWFNWSDVQNHADLLRFVRGLIRLNANTQLFREGIYWTEPGGTDILWHGVELGKPDWSADSHTLAFELLSLQSGEHLHVMMNAHHQPLQFALPALPPNQRFHRILDTALPAPQDFTEAAAAPPAESGSYLVGDHAVVLLAAR
jgi:glycogen operon protein